MSYCVGDVQYLPKLWDRFRWKTNRWRDLVNDETKKHVAASQKPEYQPHGRDKTLAPWSEDQNRTLDEWNYVPPRDYFNDDYFDDDWDDGRGDNDYEDWTRADWQGPPS
jgi:exonuclease 3'-5' domain-containing protein 1